MPRMPRAHRPHSVRHVTTRGVNRQDIFRSDLDRHYFLKITREAFEKHDIDLLTYNLMPNHVHYLVGVQDVPLGRAMHDVLTKHAILFNQRYERSGHLFQNRFFDTEIHDGAYLINATAYIHLNAVRAGLAARIDDWPWSSHRQFMAGGGPQIRLDRLRDLTGMSPEQLRAEYEKKVDEHLKPPVLSGLTIREIVRRAALSFGIEPEGVLMGRRRGYHTRAKRRAAEWALRQGFSLTDVARELGCSRASLALLLGEPAGSKT